MSEGKNSAAGKGVPFFTRVKTELQKLFVHLPGWEASAAATLTYVAPLVEALLSLADPEATPMVAGLVEKMQSAMAAAAVVIKDAGPEATLMTYLKAVKSDANLVLSEAGVKDPNLRAKLTGVVETITNEVEAILAEIKAQGGQSNPA